MSPALLAAIESPPTPQASGAETEPDAPIADVLATVSAELADLARLGDQLQSVLSPVLQQALAGDPAGQEELQSLDLLVQRLYGLEAFLTGLSRGVTARCRADRVSAAAGVKLADLADRLAGRLPGSASPAAPEDGFELF